MAATGMPSVGAGRGGAMEASRISVALVCWLALLAGAQAASGVNHERGRLLYENHCQECHESTVHIREDRRAESIGGISYQVTRWQRELRLGWDAEEVNDVVRYLNRRYYHFAPARR